MENQEFRPRILLQGQLTAKIRRIGESFKESTPCLCTWAIRSEQEAHKSQWIICTITEDRTTGFARRLILKAGSKISQYALQHIFQHSDYRFGYPSMSDDNVVIMPQEPLQRAILEWLKGEDEIFSLCMTCKKIYNRKSAGGGYGGISHGLCGRCQYE